MCDNCQCSHVPDLGACPTFEQGSNGRCVYCDHAEGCHPGDSDHFNTPLGQDISTTKATEAASALSESVRAVGGRAGSSNLHKQLQQCKVIASWDPESGCSIGFLRQSLRGRSGYANVVQANGSVYLVWSADWIPQNLAEIAVTHLPRQGEEPDMASIASSLAALFLKEHLEAGGRLSIPSLQADTPDDLG